MTRLWILSDLHMEADPAGRRRLQAPECDVLVLAGDVSEGDVRACVEAAARLADGRPAVMVLGNHDLYGLPIDRACAVAARIGLPLGVHVLERGSAEVEGIRFAGGTLWDEVRERVEHEGGRRPDLTHILSGAEPDFFAPPPFAPYGEPVNVEEAGRMRPATYADIRARHEATLAAIRDAGADVVVTHYPPTARALSMAGGAATWVHGHVHGHSRETRGDVDVILNAAQSRAFAERMVVEVGPRTAPAP